MKNLIFYIGKEIFEFLLYLILTIGKFRWLLYFTWLYLTIDIVLTYLDILGWLYQNSSLTFIWKLFLIFSYIILLNFKLIKIFWFYVIFIFYAEICFFYLKKNINIIAKTLISLLWIIFLVLIVLLSIMSYIGSPFFYLKDFALQNQTYKVIFQTLKEYFRYNGVYLIQSFQTKNDVVLVIGNKAYKLSQIATLLSKENKKVLCKALKNKNPYNFYFTLVRYSFNNTTINNFCLLKNKQNPRGIIFPVLLPIFLIVQVSYPREYITNFQLSPLDEKFYKKYTQELYKKYCSK